MRRRLLASTGVVLGALALAGCTGGDPEPPAPSSSAPSPSVSPSVSPTASPSDSATPRAEKPVEFIRRFVAVQNQMLTTGETAEYVSLVDAACGACSSIVTRVDQIYRAGGSISTDGWTVMSVKSLRGTSRRPVVQVWVDSAPTTFIERKGGPKKYLDGGRLLEQFELARAGDSFTLRSYVEVST